MSSPPGWFNAKIEGRSYGGDTQDNAVSGCSINRLNPGANVFWLKATALPGGQYAAPDGTRIIGGRYHNSNDNAVVWVDGLNPDSSAPNGLLVDGLSILAGCRHPGIAGNRDSGADQSDWTVLHLGGGPHVVTRIRCESFFRGNTIMTIPGDGSALGGNTFRDNVWGQSISGIGKLMIEDGGSMPSRWSDMCGGGATPGAGAWLMR